MNRYVLFTLGILFAGFASIQGQNSLKNGDFEKGFSGWNKGYWKNSLPHAIDKQCSQGAYGTSSLVFRGKTGFRGEAHVIQHFTLPKGNKKDYELSCWIKTDSYQNNWTASVLCSIDYPDADGKKKHINVGFNTPWQKNSTPWTHYRKKFSLPDAACSGTVHVMVKAPSSKAKDNSPAAVTHFDNFYLGPAEIPATEIGKPVNDRKMTLKGKPHKSNGFYRVGETMQFDLELAGAPDEPLHMEWQGKDIFGHKVASGSSMINPAKGKAVFSIIVPPGKEMGFIGIRVKVSRKNGMFVEHSLSGVRTERRNSPDPFFTWQGTTKDDLNGKNNMGSVRINCPWRLESKPGIYNFKKIDQQIKLAEKAGLTPLGFTTIYTLDRWRNPAYDFARVKKALDQRKNPFDEAYYQRYRNFVRELVRFVGPRIKDWALVNEIDLSRNNFLEEKHYIECVKIFSQELKKQYPHHTVGAIGVAGPEFRSKQLYVQKLWKELGNSLDGIYYDAYTPGRFAEGYELPCDEKIFRKYLFHTLSFMGKNKKISIEEKGFTVDYSLPVDHPVLCDNAHILTRSLLLAKTVPNVIRYAYFLRGDGAKEGKFNYGLIHGNGNPRPMAAAFAAAADFFANAENGKLLKPSDQIYACVFSRGKQSLFALWSLEKNAVNTGITFPVAYKESDYMGNIASRPAGKRNFVLHAAPLFFELDYPREKLEKMIMEASYQIPELSASIRAVSINELAVEVVNKTNKQLPVTVSLAGVSNTLSGTLKSRESREFHFTKTWKNGNIEAMVKSKSTEYPVSAYIQAQAIPQEGAEIVMDTPADLYPVDAIPAGLWRGKDDLSARVKLSYDDRTFKLKVYVKDDVHISRHNHLHIWNQDAIQFGFDTANEEGKSMEKYAEFCMALTPRGPELFCYKDINAQKNEQVIADAKLAIRRENDNTTVYDCAIPWKYLGELKKNPGKIFGFNLVTLDQDTPRGGVLYWMQLSPGITGGRNPALFRKFYLKGSNMPAAEIIEKTFRRFKSLERTERMLVFPLITDLHSILKDIDPAEPGLRNTLPVIHALHEADKLFDFDFYADLGDIGLELKHTKSAPDAKALIEAYAAAHAQTSKPVLVCMGNHDYNHGKLSPKKFGERFNLPSLRRGHALTFGKDPSYGFLELRSKKFRIFFLNTGNGRPYRLDEAQTDFLKNHLQELDTGWMALILMHVCPHPAGAWVDSDYKPDSSLTQFGRIIEKYADRIGGIFCGDSHFDAEFHIGGIPGFVSQGYGGVLESSMPAGARKNPFDSTQTMLAEIVVVRPEKKRIDLLRMGIKDVSADRTAIIKK